MSVIDVVDLATGQEIVLMIVTMDTEDLVEGQGHQEGEGLGAGQGHVIGAGGQEAVAVTAGEAGAVIVEVAVEVTGAGLTAGHDQGAGQEHLKTNKNRLMEMNSQSQEVLHQLAIKIIQNRLLSYKLHFTDLVPVSLSILGLRLS